MGLFKKKRNYAFSDILKGLQYAVNSVQDMLLARQVQNMEKFWHDNDGSPVCKKIKIGDKEIDVPLISLVSQNHLEMEDVEIRFRMRIGDADIHSFTDSAKDNNGLSYAELQFMADSIKVTDNDTMDITVRFKVKSSPDGIAHLTDCYNRHIQ